MPTCDVTVTTDALTGISTLADSLQPLTICRCRCVCRSRVCRESRSPPRGPYLALSHHAHPGHHHALAGACLLKAWGVGTQKMLLHLKHNKPSSSSACLKYPPVAVCAHSLVYRELSDSLRLVLGGLFEAALAGRSPLRPLVSRSTFALPTLMLGARLALLVWSSAHPPDA